MTNDETAFREVDEAMAADRQNAFFRENGTAIIGGALAIVATGIAMGFALLCHRGSPLLMLLPPLGIYALLTWRQLKFLVALRGTLFILIIAVAIAHGHLYDYYVVSEHVVAKPGSETGAYVFQELKHGLLSGDGLFFHYISLITIHFPHFVGWLWIPCAAFLARPDAPGSETYVGDVWDGGRQI